MLCRGAGSHLISWRRHSTLTPLARRQMTSRRFRSSFLVTLLILSYFISLYCCILEQTLRTVQIHGRIRTCTPSKRYLCSTIVSFLASRIFDSHHESLSEPTNNPNRSILSSCLILESQHSSPVYYHQDYREHIWQKEEECTMYVCLCVTRPRCFVATVTDALLSVRLGRCYSRYADTA